LPVRFPAGRTALDAELNLVCLTWNAFGLANFGRELTLCNLAASSKADIISVTEVEYRANRAPFAMDGYTTFLPLVEKGAKTRVLVLVKSSLATEANATLRTDLMTTSIPTVWVELGPHVQRVGDRTALHRGLLYAGVYRQWEDTLIVEREATRTDWTV
jgi:hypothetical protein